MIGSNKREWQAKIAESLGLNPWEVVNLDIHIRYDSPIVRVEAELMVKDNNSFYGVLQDLQYQIIGMKSE